jgi:hypothetical protein
MNRTFRALPLDGTNPAQAGAFSTATNATADLDVVSAATASQYCVVAMSGTTAQRPQASDADVAGHVLKAGQWFIDTSLSLAIVWSGTSWRDPVAGTVV